MPSTRCLVSSRESVGRLGNRYGACGSIWVAQSPRGLRGERARRLISYFVAVAATAVAVVAVLTWVDQAI
jgi:hypothetical protein